MLFRSLTVGLQWHTQAPSCAQPWLQPGAHSSPFRLSPRSQSQSLSLVCPLKPKFQHPALKHTSRCVSWAGECKEVARTLCAILSLFCRLQTSCCTFLWAIDAPFLSWLISLPVQQLPSVRALFLFHSSLPGVQIPSRFLFFSFILPGYMVIFLVILAL